MGARKSRGTPPATVAWVSRLSYRSGSSLIVVPRVPSTQIRRTCWCMPLLSAKAQIAGTAKKDTPGRIAPNTPTWWSVEREGECR